MVGNRLRHLCLPSLFFVNTRFCSFSYNFLFLTNSFFVETKMKSMKAITISMFLMATIISICKAPTKRNAMVEEARKAIEASNAIYSQRANKIGGYILTRYTVDACLLPPNGS